MERLADGSGMGQSLSALVDTLVSWMSEDQPDLEVISMCAVATSHPKNAIQMAFSGDMWNAVMREMRNGIERDDPPTYYKLIRIATNMSKYDCPVIGRHPVTGIERREYRSAQNFIKRRSGKKFFKDISECLKNLYELNLINKRMLSSFEINWINNYHKKVYQDLSNLIDKDDTELLLFLKRKTTTI